MIERQKAVFYCEHCRKHGLSRYAMEQHERLCTLNPLRACRWGGPHSFDYARLAAEFAAHAPCGTEDILTVHDEVNGCPACMLAVFRQSGVEYHYGERGENLWDYKEEVERYRALEREERMADQW